MKTRLFWAPRRARPALFMCFVLAVSAATEDASAQERVRAVLPVVPPTQALDLVANGEKGAPLIIAAFEEDEVEAGTVRLGNRRLYSDQDRRMLLDGVEQLAIGGGHGDPATRKKARSAAFEVLEYIGVHRREELADSREIPSRTLRIFNRSDDPVSVLQALHLMGRLLSFNPPEARELAEALFQAVQEPGELFTQGIAIEVLLTACEAALPTLQRVQREGIVTEPVTHVWFRNLAERGFPLEDMVKQRGGEPCPGGRGLER